MKTLTGLAGAGLALAIAVSTAAAGSLLIAVVPISRTAMTETAVATSPGDPLLAVTPGVAGHGGPRSTWGAGLAVPADDDEGNPALQTRLFEVQAVVKCQIHNGRVVIANAGRAELAAGTMLRWQTKGASTRGYIALREALEAGQSVSAENALPDGTRACAARVV